MRYAVHHDLRVAVSQFVVFLDNLLLVFFVAFFDELLGAEQVDELSLFVGLLHGALQLLVREHRVSVDGYLVYLYFRLLVDIYVYVDLFFVFGVFTLDDIDFRVLESLFVEMLFDEYLCAVYQVRRDLRAFRHAELGHQVFAFALFHSVDNDVRNSRALPQLDGQPDFVAFNLVCQNLHVGEQSVPPVSFQSRRDVIARNGDGLPHSQSGDAYQHVVFVILYAADFDVGYFVLLGCSVVQDDRFLSDFRRIVVLCKSGYGHARENQQDV